MLKLKKIIGLFMAIACVVCMCGNVYATAPNLSKEEYYETEDWSVWSEVEDGILYVIVSCKSGEVYVSKVDITQENSNVYEMKLDSNLAKQVEKKTGNSDYWDEIKSLAKDNAQKFSVVTNVRIENNNSRGTTAENYMISHMESKIGSEYYNYLRKIDNTSYPGTTIRVYEKLTLGAQQNSAVAFEAGSYVSSVAATVLARIPGCQVAAAVVSAISLACGTVAIVNSVFTKGGTIIPVYGSAVTKRYCTINGGSVVCSEAHKQVVFAGTYYREGGKFGAAIDHTVYSPSEYCYGTSNGYQWLISTAYNNYT